MVFTAFIAVFFLSCGNVMATVYHSRPSSDRSYSFDISSYSEFLTWQDDWGGLVGGIRLGVWPSYYDESYGGSDKDALFVRVKVAVDAGSYYNQITYVGIFVEKDDNQMAIAIDEDEISDYNLKGDESRDVGTFILLKFCQTLLQSSAVNLAVNAFTLAAKLTPQTSGEGAHEAGLYDNVASVVWQPFVWWGPYPSEGAGRAIFTLKFYDQNTASHMAKFRVHVNFFNDYGYPSYNFPVDTDYINVYMYRSGGGGGPMVYKR